MATQTTGRSGFINNLGKVYALYTLGFLVFFALIGEIGPARATVITYVNPAVAAVLGVAVLGETFTVGMGIGFVLVLAGSVLATRPALGRDEASPALEPAPSER